MPILTVASAASVPRFDPQLQENARVFPIGVSRYDHFPDSPVHSATDNALAWLIVALRMGVSPYENTLMAEEFDKTSLRTRIEAALKVADLGAAEREGLQGLERELERLWNEKSKAEKPEEEKEPSSRRIQRPTFANLLAELLYLGNHLEWNSKCRALVTWSGHGALHRGRLALCPSDATPTPVARSEGELRCQIEALQGTLDTRAARSAVEDAQQYRQAAALIGAMARVAAKKNALAELLDVLRAPVDDMGGVNGYHPEVIVKLLEFVQGNLERLPAQPCPQGPDTLGNVLTVTHFQLAFGPHDERVTIVLDACHAGGPGDALQGSTVGHDWLKAGLRARIISASQGAQLAAEARIGDRRFSAATWALTQVLSRWSFVEDGPAYALGIRNGDLVDRANQLLGALAFRQQISLHAPPPARGAPGAADLPFFGLDPATRTYVDPDAQAGGIQLGSDNPGLVLWQIKQGTTLRALWLAVGPAKNAWTPPTGFLANTLYIYSTPANVAALAGQAFDVSTDVWDGTGTQPSSFTNALSTFGDAPPTRVVALGSPAEVEWDGAPNPPGVVGFVCPNGRELFVRWLQGTGGDPPKLDIITKTGFPFVSGTDLPQRMSFTPVAQPGFVLGDPKCKHHPIAL